MYVQVYSNTRCSRSMYNNFLIFQNYRNKITKIVESCLIMCLAKSYYAHGLIVISKIYMNINNSL